MKPHEWFDFEGMMHVEKEKDMGDHRDYKIVGWTLLAVATVVLLFALLVK